jgi:hypothetical protein
MGHRVMDFDEAVRRTKKLLAACDALDAMMPGPAQDAEAARLDAAARRWYPAVTSSALEWEQVMAKAEEG